MDARLDGAALKIGLWNGAAMREGALLYRRLMESARAEGIRGGTAILQVEGSGGGRVFRSIENEAASNALPIWLEWMDERARIAAWLPRALSELRGEGVCAMAEVTLWSTGLQVAGTSQPVVRVGRRAGQRADVRPATYTTEDRRTVSGVPGLEIRVYTHEGVFLNGKPIYQAVAEWLRRRGVLWFATTRAAAGYGGDGMFRRAGVLPFRQDAPVVMTILDLHDHAIAWLPEFQALLGSAALVVSAEVTLYRPQ